MIFRVNKTKGFSVMSNYHLQDKDLSLKAKGLLSLMLSLPDDWKFSIGGLASLTREKESAIKSALDELKACKYVVVTKLLPNQTESKRIEWLYDVYENPQTDQPIQNQPIENQGVEHQGVEVQGIEVQAVENQGLQNTNLLTTNLLNTKNERKNECVKRENTRASFKEILESVPLIKENPDLETVFWEFIKHRERKKKPLTDYALKLSINRAFAFGKNDPEAIIARVNQSIERGWDGIFDLKPEGVPEPKYKATQQSVNPYTELRKKLEQGGEL